MNNIWARSVFNKNRLRRYGIIGDKQLQTLSSAANIKKKRCVTCVASYNDSWALYRASFEPCQCNRNLFSVGKKLKESIFKSNNQVSFTVPTRTWVLSKECIGLRPNAKRRIDIWIKKWRWYSFFSMVDVILQGVWYFTVLGIVLH